MVEAETKRSYSGYRHKRMRFIAKPEIIAVTVLLIMLVWSGCGQEAAPGKPVQPASPPIVQASGKNDIKTIVAVGDSLTAGLGVDESLAYPSVLEKRFLSDGYSFKVINAGVSGETSSGTLARIDWVISSLKPDTVILVTGANDGLRGIDPDLLRKNLDRLLQILKENRIRVVLGGMKMLTNLGPDYVSNFERVYPELAQKHNVTLIPFFLDGVAGEEKLNQKDGIHPNPEGYALLVNHIYPFVLKTVQEKAP